MHRARGTGDVHEVAGHEGPDWFVAPETIDGEVGEEEGAEGGDGGGELGPEAEFFCGRDVG